jgi:hypothetical protein
MGMGISSASSPAIGASMWQQQKSSFSQLSSALTSGDLGAAKQAFATLSAKNPAASDPNSPMGKLGAALQSGNMSAAQQAFSTMQTSAASQTSAAQGAGHHHHHHGGMSAVASSTATLPLATSGSVGTQVNTTA